jgi:DNA-binding NarL/FixJ family response regulator
VQDGQPGDGRTAGLAGARDEGASIAVTTHRDVAMSAPAGHTTILIVDDHTLVRQGIREILEAQGDMRVVGEAGDSQSAIAITARERPDVVLLDVEIPGGEAVATVRQIRACSPASRVIILTLYQGPLLVRDLLAAGAHGYLLKSIHWQELVAAIRAARKHSP